MAVLHGVLIERHHDVEFVAETEHRLVTDAQREKNMATAHDRLISIISIEMQASGHEKTREEIPGCRDALSSRTARCCPEIYFRQEHTSLAYFREIRLPAVTLS